MRILLDTQTFLWMTSAPDRLSPAARDLVRTTEHELFLSAASAWEIAIKYAKGRLQLPEPPMRYVPTRIDSLGTWPLAISHDHVLRAAMLPPYHRDPFDRVLVAQAQVENLPILTSDRVLAQYDVTIIAA